MILSDLYFILGLSDKIVGSPIKDQDPRGNFIGESSLPTIIENYGRLLSGLFQDFQFWSSAIIFWAPEQNLVAANVNFQLSLFCSHCRRFNFIESYKCVGNWGPKMIINDSPHNLKIVSKTFIKPKFLQGKIFTHIFLRFALSVSQYGKIFIQKGKLRKIRDSPPATKNKFFVTPKKTLLASNFSMLFTELDFLVCTLPN